MRYLVASIFFLFVCNTSFSQGVLGACGNGNPKGGFDPLNGNGTLGMTYNQSACGLNYASASQLTETRSQAAGFNTNGTGFPTTLGISGIPNCPTILRAYVWYTVSYQSSAPAASSVIINSTSVAATNIGTHGGKCWGDPGTIVFRADVTANITAPGNGNYTIDITGLANKNWEVDGVTLMIIYKDNGATYQGSLVLWDGANTCSSGGCSITQTMTGIAACGPSTLARAFLVVSDMQTASITPPQHNSTLNGATAAYPNDFYNFDVVNTTVTNAQANANFGTNANNGSDCFCWSLMGLYYQTTSCTTCVPAAVTITVTPTPASCAPNGSATAAASGAPAPYTYSWSTGASTSAISNLAAGNYSVVVTDATGCTASQTFIIVGSSGLPATITSNTVACSSGNVGSATAIPSGGTTPYTYVWSSTPIQTTPTATGLAAGTYSVLVSDASGCSATYTIAITLPTALTSTATVVNNVSCFAGTDGSAITNASGGTGAYTYLWTPSAQNTQTASGLAAGSYSITVTDVNGCTDVQSVVITEPPAMALPSGSTMASCGMSDGSATVTPSGGMAPYTYLWLTTPAVQVTQTAVNLAAGTYSVIVTDANGCFQSQSVVVGGGIPPVADFQLTPEIVSMEDPIVYFTDGSSGVIADWSWNFGDPGSGANDTSSLQNPTHVYSDTGVYCATLTIYDPSGLCSDTIVKCLKVEPQPTFYIPNAFTPNKDGKNEMFFAYGTYIGEFHMYIFDRWGNLIFESDDIYKGWNGTVDNKGDVVQEDVYVWKVKFLDTIGAEFNYVGHVTIVK